MLRILTIGNSFAQNALRYFAELCAGKMDVFIGAMNLGGCSLEKHWNLVRQCDMLPEVKPYTFVRTGREDMPATLVEALRAEPWDYITLQQVSDKSFHPETYEPFLGELAALVRQHAPGAQIVLHETWAYRCDAPELERYGVSQKEMHQSLVAAYEKAAESLGCRVLPCGRAFFHARKALNYVPDARFDFENAKPYALPCQDRALIVGYHWRTGNTASGRAELAMDGRHGTAMGCYLAGAVWYGMFSGLPLEEITFCPQEIRPEDQGLLLRAAAKAIEEAGGALRKA